MKYSPKKRSQQIMEYTLIVAVIIAAFIVAARAVHIRETNKILVSGEALKDASRSMERSIGKNR